MNATTPLKTDELIDLEREVSEGRGTPTLLRRLERVRHRQQKEALGRVARALRSYEFRDGVLHTACLRGGKHLGECARDPQWATVEVLEFGWGSLKGLGMPLSDFLDAMPLLHTLSLHGEQLPERPCPGITTLQAGGPVEVALIAERFPALEALALSFSGRSQELWGAPFIQQLESLTLGALTWKGDVVTARSSPGNSFAEWLVKGPPFRRLEIQEEEVFGAHAADELQALFDAARRKGADVVLLPEPEPRSRWQRDRYDPWH
jgi:hypothetical protein